MNIPHIGVNYIEDLPTEPFEDFSTLIQHEKLNYKCESRPRLGPSAGVEWLLPTAVIVFIGKTYFDAFLKEAGKDHYDLLKKGLEKLSAKFTGPTSPPARMYFSDGKIKSPTPKYSLLYSVVAELGNGISVKLLLQPNFTAEENNSALHCFLQFLDALHDGSLDPTSVKGLVSAKPVGRTLLVAFNPESKALEVIDPIPR